MPTPPSDNPILSPEDLQAWLHVRTGLRVIRFVLTAIVVLIVVTMLCLCISTALNDIWPLLIPGLLVLSLPFLLLFGLALCGLAPAVSDARRYAQGIFVLALSGIGIFSIVTAVEAMREFGVLNQAWIRELINTPHIGTIVYWVALTNLTLAVVCWQRFLHGVAVSFGNRKNAANATQILRWFLVWSSALYLLPGAFFVPWDLQTSLFLGVIYLLVTLGLVTVLFVWTFALLDATEKMIFYAWVRNQFDSATTMDSTPPGDQCP